MAMAPEATAMEPPKPQGRRLRTSFDPSQEEIAEQVRLYESTTSCRVVGGKYQKLVALLRHIGVEEYRRRLPIEMSRRLARRQRGEYEHPYIDYDLIEAIGRDDWDAGQQGQLSRPGRDTPQGSGAEPIGSPEWDFEYDEIDEAIRLAAPIRHDERSTS